jgi:hypothetical protein
VGPGEGRGRRRATVSDHRGGPARLDGRPQPTRFPIARLRYTKATGQWAIYWRDRNLKFHEYRHKRPSKNVQSLLDYIREGKDPIFFG